MTNLGEVSENERRLTAVFRIHVAQVLAYAIRRVGIDAAQDIVSDTFLEAWRHIESLSEDPLPWLYRTASFQIAHRWRDLDRRDRDVRALRSVSGELVDADPALDVVSADLWAKGFAGLSDQDQEILRLVAWENLSPRDAASVLGCSVTAFNVRLHRARNRLVARIDAGGGDRKRISGSLISSVRTRRTDIQPQSSKGPTEVAPFAAVKVNVPLAAEVVIQKEVQ